MLLLDLQVFPELFVFPAVALQVGHLLGESAHLLLQLGILLLDLPSLEQMPVQAAHVFGNARSHCLQRCGDHREQLGGERGQSAGHGCPQHEGAQYHKHCCQDLELCTLEKILHPWGPPVICGVLQPEPEPPLIKQNTTSSTAK